MPGNWTPAALRQPQQPRQNPAYPAQQAQQPAAPYTYQGNAAIQQQPQPAAPYQNQAQQAPQQPAAPYQGNAAIQQQPAQPAAPYQGAAQQQPTQPAVAAPIHDVRQQPQASLQQPTQAAQSQQPQSDYQEDNKVDNIFGNGVVMDFKPLFTPPEKGYASVYGKPSVITATITKFGQQGQQTVTVRHNIAPCVTEAMEDVAKKFAYLKPSSASDMVIPSASMAQLNNALGAVYAAINALNQGQPPTALNDAANLLGSTLPTIHPAGNDPDFYFQEVKVNSWKIGNDGYAPVSTIEIQRCGMRNGEPARYPWIFTIENFEAVARKSQKGTVTYDSSTKRSQPGKERGITIMASDKDVFNLANRTRHFIDAWITRTTTAALRAAERK